MNVVIFFILLASMIDGILEGDRWSGHKLPLITKNFDAYHPMAAISHHGAPFIVLALFILFPPANLAFVWHGIPWKFGLNLSGAILAGPLGLREWFFNIVTRGTPVPKAKQPLRIMWWSVPRYPILQAIICLVGGAILCII